MMDAIIAHPRGVGRNGGWVSLVTGLLVDNGPDLSMFVKSRADAYRLVDWVTPIESADNYRIDRARVDYRAFEPQWLQVKLIVEEEHQEVLNRLSEVLYLRDGYLDAELIKWAIDPDNHRDPGCMGLVRTHAKLLDAATSETLT